MNFTSVSVAKHLRYNILCACFVAVCCGCTPLAVGGFATGVLLAADRRTSGAQIEDESIELRALARIRDVLGDKGHVNAISYNRQVLLTGEVPAEQDKERLEQVIAQLENVRSVVNDVVVLGVSSLTQRSSDSFITAKVKTALVDTQDISANTIKVVTERGIVYLMGRVTQKEAAIATQVARTTVGVQRVVRVFDIISDEELKRLQAPVLSSLATPPVSVEKP